MASGLTLRHRHHSPCGHLCVTDTRLRAPPAIVVAPASAATPGVRNDRWKKYIQLTEVEAAFRTLKSELAIRPLFHQLEKRVKTHVLVAFLGYALLVTLKHLLKRSASEYSPAKALKRLSELHSVDIVLPTVEGKEIWLRRISKLDEDQQRIFHQLQLQLPERLDPIQIQKCRCRLCCSLN